MLPVIKADKTEIYYFHKCNISIKPIKKINYIDAEIIFASQI